MKRLTLVVVALAAGAVSLAAQQPAASPNPIVTSFRATGTQYGRWLAQAFDSIPEGKYGYKPMPVQLTVGNIAQHLENANYQLCALFSNQKYVMTAKDSLADSIKAKWPKDTLATRLKASLAYCDDALSKVTDAMLADQIPIGPAAAGRTITRSRYLIAYVTDLADHYSQISNYMRLNSMLPPSALPRKP